MQQPIFNNKGAFVSLEAAIYYMAPDLLKAALISHPFDDCQAFYDEYSKLHLEKFGKSFVFEEDDEEEI